MDTLLPALLEEGLYHADGQILDEVYVYGSYLQSKMYAAGVGCSDCHGGLNLSGPMAVAGELRPSAEHHNTALYNLDGNGAYPASDTGLAEETGAATDMGSFRAPTLRNIALTAPYMHDGSLATLADVVAFYRRGGGANPDLDPLLVPLELSDREAAALVAFLEALSRPAGQESPDPGAGPAAGSR